MNNTSGPSPCTIILLLGHSELIISHSLVKLVKRGEGGKGNEAQYNKALVFKWYFISIFKVTYESQISDIYSISDNPGFNFIS